jgi:hypothetical protein
MASSFDNLSRMQFAWRWRDVEQVLNAFEFMKIYITDVSPGNIAF